MEVFKNFLMRLIRNKLLLEWAGRLTPCLFLRLLLYHENEFETLPLIVVYIVLTIYMYTANSLLLAR